MLKHCLVASLFVSMAAAQQPYGDPTPGTGGFEPRLSAAGPWIGNAAFGFDIQGGLGSTIAFLAFSAAPANLSLFGFNLLLDPASQLGSVVTLMSGGGPGQGEAFVPLPLTLPPTPALIGAPFFAQVILSDGGSPGGNFSASRGLRCELGLTPLVFVGCSIIASDPFQLIDPATNSIVDSGSPPQVDNVSGAAFAGGGEWLFVASSIRGTIGMANTQSLPATWSTIFTSASPRCFGVAVDSVRDLLWTLTDPGTGSRELTAIDVDQGSATFGQVMANTVGVASGIYERWTLSPSGNLAAVLTALPGTLTVVDTRPGSPTFLQSLFSAISVPVDQPGSLTIPNKVLITPDDRYALILIQLPGATPGEIARFDIDNGVWVDHNPVQPGTQNMSPMSSPPVVLGGAPYGFALAADGRFAIASGFNGCGWVGRLTLDPQNTQSFSWTVWSPGIDLGNAWSAGLAADETEVGIATWPSNQCATVASARLVRLDAATGALLGTVPIPFNVNSSTLQNLYTVVYR